MRGNEVASVEAPGPYAVRFLQVHVCCAPVCSDDRQSYTSGTLPEPGYTSRDVMHIAKNLRRQKSRSITGLTQEGNFPLASRSAW